MDIWRSKQKYRIILEEFYKKISTILKKNDTILVKASRGMELDKVVENIRKTR